MHLHSAAPYQSSDVNPPPLREVGVGLHESNDDAPEDAAEDRYILTHAPLAPWLAPSHQFAAGAYMKINKNVGSLIDWVRLRSVSHIQ